MTAVEVTSRVLGPAEAAELWRLAMDWARQSEWMPGTRVSGGQGTGATVTARTGVGPVGFTDTMVITQWRPPHRCVVRHTGRVVRGTGIFEVIPRGPMSEFVWTEKLWLPWPVPGWLARRLAGGPGRWLMDASLRRLRRLLAGEQLDDGPVRLGMRFRLLLPFLGRMASYQADVRLRGPLRLLDPLLRRGFTAVGGRSVAGRTRALSARSPGPRG
jgi:carbon monoxide dehydrogenase subunit G